MTERVIACWIGGLSLIALTIAMHAIGLVQITLLLQRLLRWMDAAQLEPRSIVWMARLTLAATGAALALLHAAEAAIWALTFYWIGAIPTMADSLLYSIDSMATRGSSGLVLAEEWRLMGALEASDGMLLFGISTAFLFTVMLRLWAMLTGGALAAVTPAGEAAKADPGHIDSRPR